MKLWRIKNSEKRRRLLRPLHSRTPPADGMTTSVLAGAAVAHAFRQIAGLYLIFSGDQVIVEIKFIGEAVGLLLYISLKVGYCRIYA